MRIGGFLKQSLIDWEAEWAESATSFAVGMVIAAALVLVTVLVLRVRAGSVKAANAR